MKKSKKDVIDQLRLEIKKQLLKCNNRGNTPRVCAEIQTMSGYRKIEDQIIRMAINEQLTPAAAIVQIESEL